MQVLLILLVGFWTRFNPNPPIVPVDSAFAAKQAERAAKPVQFCYVLRQSRVPCSLSSAADYTELPSVAADRCAHTGSCWRQARVDGRCELHPTPRRQLAGRAVDPIAWYHFSYKGFDAGMGAIPYTRRIMPVPEWLMYDSLTYFHPNI